MLRLCHKSCSYSKFIFQPAKQAREVTSQVNTICALNNIIQRQYSIKIKEEVDNKWTQIYYGPLTPQIKAVKVFSLSSSIAGLLAQPIIIKEAASIGSTSLVIALCSVVGFFTFITPILLHLVTKKYVTEIHLDTTTSTYKATTINFFLAKKQHIFTPDDVEVPDIPGMFTTMKAKGQPLFIEARFFSDPIHYAKIMGYDKPLDFKLYQTEDSDKEK